MLPSWSDLAAHLRLQEQAADDPDSLGRVFRSVVEPFGIDAFACGKLHLGDRRLNAFFIIDWPDAWRSYYIKSGLIDRDPLLDHLKHATAPFTWSELKRRRLLTSAGTEALRGVAERGWTEGIVVPVEIGHPVIGLISLVARREAFSAEEKAALTLLSSHFYLRAKQMALTRGLALAPAGLTAREIACLQHIALGLSDRQVGEELGIATATAHEHFETAKRKLNATTRSAVIALAIALAVIRPL